MSTNRPYEARKYDDLIEPFQVEVIKDFCERLGTTPEAEAKAMYGDADFYCLTKTAADKLTVALAERARPLMPRPGAVSESQRSKKDE